MSSYQPSTRGSSANTPDSDSEDAESPRRVIDVKSNPRTAAAAAAASAKKRKNMLEELGGQQVISTAQSTSYGSGSAVRPIQIKRYIEGGDILAQMQNIVGGTSVPLNPMARVPGETHKLHGGKAASRAPSVSTAMPPPAVKKATPAKAPPATKKATPAKSAVRDSPAFEEASEAVDRAKFNKDQATPVPRKRTTAAKPALSQVAEESENAPPPRKEPVAKPAPKQAAPRFDARLLGPPTPFVYPPAKPRSVVRPHSQPLPSGESSTSKLLSWTDNAKKFFVRLWNGIKEYIRTILSILGLLLILLLLIFGTDNMISREAPYSYHTAINNIRHHTPTAFAHPLYWFNHVSIRDLNKRVEVLEIDVDQLKLDVERDHKAIAGLSKQIPDFVVAKKNKKGELELPINFWHAIKGKITNDKDLHLGKSGDSKPAAVNWNDFWLSNEQRLKTIATDEVKVSRAEIEKIIQRDIESLKKHSAEDVAKLRKQIEFHYAKKSDQLSQAQITKLINDASHRSLSSSKIEALITNKIREQSSQRLRSMNHFAFGMGAVILSRQTAPIWTADYHEGVSTGGKVLGNLLKVAADIEPPKPLEAKHALQPWMDTGDCWCGATQVHGVDIGIRTKESIYPSEIVVEHVNPEATLDKGAAPKDMELFVKVPLSKQDEIAQASERMFADAAEETVLDHTWVRVARWTYDLEANENMQVFGLQLDLKRYRVAATDFVVRARTNWGSPPVDHTCLYRVRMHGSLAEKSELAGNQG